jgi:hypothetical protein
MLSSYSTFAENRLAGVFVEVAAPATKRRNAQARERAALWQKFGRRPFLVLAFIDFSCLVRDNLQPMF